jgi:hypothetical protein
MVGAPFEVVVCDTMLTPEPSAQTERRGQAGETSAWRRGAPAALFRESVLGLRSYVSMYVPSMFAVLPLVPDESVLLTVLATVNGSI